MSLNQKKNIKINKTKILGIWNQKNVENVEIKKVNLVCKEHKTHRNIVFFIVENINL